MMRSNLIGPIPKPVRSPVFPTPWEARGTVVYDALDFPMFDAEDTELAELLVTLVNIQAKTGAVQLEG